MRIIEDGAISTGECVLALGMFDGMHLGHRVIMRKAAALALRIGAPLVAGTFSIHPVRVISQGLCPPMLTTLRERAMLMDLLGVDIVFAQPFTREVMQTPPERYIAGLCTRFHPRHIVAGFDYSFGAKGEGGPELLTALGDVFGYTAHIVPMITYEGREVSSSAIRNLLENGDARGARLLLGRPYLREITLISPDKPVFVDNDKLIPRAGAYRCLLRQSDGCVPVTARIGENGVTIASYRAPDAGSGELLFIL